jgi:hypothetical protein
MTITTAIPSGSVIVVGAEWGSNNAGTLGTITDDVGNTYTQIDHTAMGNPSNGCGLFYAQNVAALVAGQHITLNIANPVGTYGALIIAACFPNRKATGSLDQHVFGTTTNSGNITTTLASELIVGFITGYPDATFTQDANFTTAQTVTHGGSNVQMGSLAYRLAATVGTYNYNPTISLTGQASTFIASFA